MPKELGAGTPGRPGRSPACWPARQALWNVALGHPARHSLALTWQWPGQGHPRGQGHLRGRATVPWTISIHEDSHGAGSLTWLPPSQVTLHKALGLCFPICQLQTESQEPQAGSPLLHPAQVSCQACVPGWVPALSSPGFVLVSGCHGDQSRLLWQERAPPGQGSASPHQPLPCPSSSARSARGWIRGKETWVSGKLGQGLSSRQPPSDDEQGPCQLLGLGLAPGAE